MIVYKTTNLLNGKFYVGKDSKNDESYIGSGKILKQAIKKYGRENFKKEILEYCVDLNHLNEREKFWIAELKCRESDICYNIGTGGDGGDNITFNPNRPAFIDKMRKINGENNGMTGKHHSDLTIKKQKQKAEGRFTLQWYIERYGDEVGELKYRSRCTDLSSKRIKDNNPAYVHVDEHLISDYIRSNPNCTLKDVFQHLKIGNTCLYNKFLIYYGTKKFGEVKNILLTFS